MTLNEDTANIKEAVIIRRRKVFTGIFASLSGRTSRRSVSPARVPVLDVRLAVLTCTQMRVNQL
jgi:hypothetical protein